MTGQCKRHAFGHHAREHGRNLLRRSDMRVCCSYWLDPYSLFFIEVILMQFAEIRRWQDFRKPGSQGDQYFLGLETVLKGSGDPSYPGQLSLGRSNPCMPCDV